MGAHTGLAPGKELFAEAQVIARLLKGWAIVLMVIPEASGAPMFSSTAELMVPSCRAYLANTVPKPAEQWYFAEGVCVGRTMAVAQMVQEATRLTFEMIKDQENWEAENGQHGVALRSESIVRREDATCFPDMISLPQLITVVVRYIERHSKRLNEDYDVVARDAFHEAWPCR